MNDHRAKCERAGFLDDFAVSETGRIPLSARRTAAVPFGPGMLTLFTNKVEVQAFGDAECLLVFVDRLFRFATASVGFCQQEMKLGRFDAGAFYCLQLLLGFVNHFQPQAELAVQESENQVFATLENQATKEVE